MNKKDEQKKIKNLLDNEDTETLKLMYEINQLLNKLNEKKQQYLFAFQLKDDSFIYMENLHLAGTNHFLYSLHTLITSKIESANCDCNNCTYNIESLINFLNKLGFNLNIEEDNKKKNIDIIQKTIANIENTK